MSNEGRPHPPERRRTAAPAPPGVPARSGASQPQLVKDLLAAYLDRSGLREGLEAVSLVDQWPELVGPGIAAVTRVKKVADGVMVVGVATSAWLMELNLMKKELLSRTNAGRRAGKIRQIIFVMDG